MKNSFIITLGFIAALAMVANTQSPFDPNYDYNLTFIQWWPFNSSLLRICQTPSADGTYCAQCKTGATRQDDIYSGVLKSRGVCQYAWPPDNCYVFDWNFNCVLCHDGYWMNVSVTNSMNLCQPKTYGCQIYNSQAKKCNQCMPGWTMNNTVNGASNLTEYFCYFVPDVNCLKYDANNICLGCATNYTVYNNKCLFWLENCAIMNGNVCSKCGTNFQIDATGKCVAIPKVANCASQVDYTCSSCLTDYNLINNQCISLVTIADCAQISGTVCAKCNSGYFITTDGKCAAIPSISNCLNQVDFTCQSCIAGYALVNNACVYIIDNCAQVNGVVCAKCNTNFQITSNGKCAAIPKVPNCASQIDYTCQSCVAGYALANNQCTYIIENCAQVNGMTCAKCNSGYDVTVDGKCAPIPKIPNCVTQLDYNCQACVTGWALSNNQCTYIIDNCAQVNGMVCSKCNSGYDISVDGKCAPIPRISNCVTQIDYNCQACVTGWALSNNQCTYIIDNCALVNGMVCSKCNTDYSIDVDGKCTFIPRISNCASQVDFACSSCATGYALVNNACVYIIQNCTQVNGMVCAQCNTNYAITIDGKCQLIPKVANCASQVEFTCQSCLSGFILFNNQCSAVTPKCLEYTGATCSKCQTDYLLTILNTCQFIPRIAGCLVQVGPMCMQCNTGFSLMNNACTFRIDNCLKVTGTVCEQCKEGFLVGSDGKCAADPFFGLDLNCRLYDLATFNKCLVCSGGFFLNKVGKCEQVDPLCKTYNGNNGFCISCYVGYSLDNAKGKCLKISSLTSEAAIDYCNQWDWGNNICVKCAEGCYFDANGKCQKYSDDNCKTPSVDLKTCAECYKGYSFDVSQGKCIVGDFNCATWSNGKCATCPKGYYLDDNSICVMTDPFCYIFSQTTKKCILCYPGYVWDSEKKCKLIQEVSADLAKYSLNCAKVIDGQCTECYFGYYVMKDTVGAYCGKANDLCKSYDKLTGKCTSCYLGYYLSGQGECLRYF